MENSAQKWDSEVDVAIVGAGGAGIAAAIGLAERKMSVIVFEKQPSIADASTSLCGGVYAFAGTDFQKKAGVADTNDLLFKDLREVGGKINNEKLVRIYVDTQLDVYNWMTALGVKWLSLVALAGMTVPRGHVADPAEALKVLKETADRKGTKIIFDTPVTELVIEKGRVAGVVAKGKVQRIKARKGVLLASGGFGRDFKRLASIDPNLVNVVPIAGPGITGDGHRMAEALGAHFADMEYVKPTFGIHYKARGSDGLCFLYYNGAIVVNREGKRFIDESKSYKDIGKASVAQTESLGFQILDQKIYDAAVEKGKEGKGFYWALDDARIKLLVKAPTIEELAAKLGIPPAALRQTVDRYNRGVAAGRDTEFGRAAIAGSSGKLVTIDKPPFYCYISKSFLPATYGGIVVDERMRVLNRQGPIPGLYAAGEITGGFHGVSYMSGTGVGKAVVFGRYAANMMAEG